MTQLTSKDKITDIMLAKAKTKIAKQDAGRKKSKLIMDTIKHSILQN
jgi:hypothetical protein